MRASLRSGPTSLRIRGVICAIAGVFMLLLGAQFRPAHAQVAGGKATNESLIVARAVHVVENGGAEGAGLVIDLSRETSPHIDVLSNPPRLVIDLPGTAFAAGQDLHGQKGQGPVQAWRAGLFMMGQSRIVLDLNRPALVERQDFISQGGTSRLVLAIRTVTQARFNERVAQSRTARLSAQGTQTSEPMTPRKAGAKPLLVLDPGHGGIDSGALGAKGVLEKDIVLSTALAVKKALEADGRVEVALTREDDRFIPLGERVKFARTKGAALFVSFHADSLRKERDVRGASIYTLSDRASDRLAAQAAEKENKADESAGLDPDEGQREGVEDILFDLVRRETRLFSHVVAREAAGAFKKHERLHKTPLRSAAFRVLKAPDVPSILIELGYLTNPDDLKVLSDSSQRDVLTKDLAARLVRFVLTERQAISPRAVEQDRF